MITLFDMLFDAEGVHPDPEKVEAIRAIHAGPTGCPRTPVLSWYSNIHGSFYSKYVCLV